MRDGCKIKMKLVHEMQQDVASAAPLSPGLNCARKLGQGRWELSIEVPAQDQVLPS
jgi:hypothetical protein